MRPNSQLSSLAIAAILPAAIHGAVITLTETVTETESGAFFHELSSSTSDSSSSTLVKDSTSSSVDSSYSNSTEFKSTMLYAHNFYRQEHNASDLVWNDTSAKYAANWAKKCNFEHSGGPTGENLASGYANTTASVDAWGGERSKYSWSSPGFSEDTGHFTQLVWKATTSVGCGRAACNGDNDTPGEFVVCEYYPAGNVIMEGDDKNILFEENVDKQIEGPKDGTVEEGLNGTSSSASTTRAVVTGSMASVVRIGGIVPVLAAAWNAL